MHLLWLVCWFVTAVSLIVLERRKRKLTALDYLLVGGWPFMLMLECATQAVVESNRAKPDDYGSSPWFPRGPR